MSSSEVDQYLASFSGPGLSTATDLRAKLLGLLPEGEEGISYSMPVIKLNSKAIAGFAIAKSHVGYYPHSSLVLPALQADLVGYKFSKGALQIPSGEFIAEPLLKKLVRKRIELLGISEL